MKGRDVAGITSAFGLIAGCLTFAHISAVGLALTVVFFVGVLVYSDDC